VRYAILPPSAVKTVKDLIFWQYAKIIADSAGIGKKDYGFVMAKSSSNSSKARYSGIKSESTSKKKKTETNAYSAGQKPT
jgi:hypothetical protein